MKNRLLGCGTDEGSAVIETGIWEMGGGSLVQSGLAVEPGGLFPLGVAVSCRHERRSHGSVES